MNDSQRSGSESSETSTGIYFLICSDPTAYSFHKDYYSTDSYCNGLKHCIKRGYDIIRLSGDEAKDKRSDPCDFCYGH